MQYNPQLSIHFLSNLWIDFGSEEGKYPLETNFYRKILCLLASPIHTEQCSLWAFQKNMEEFQPSVTVRQTLRQNDNLRIIKSYGELPIPTWLLRSPLHKSRVVLGFFIIGFHVSISGMQWHVICTKLQLFPKSGVSTVHLVADVHVSSKKRLLHTTFALLLSLRICFPTLWRL